MQSFQQVMAGKKRRVDEEMIPDGKTISRVSGTHAPPRPRGSCRGQSRGWVLVRDQGLQLVRGGILWLCGKRPYFVKILKKAFRRETVSWQSFALTYYSTITREGMFAARKTQSCCIWERGTWTFTVPSLLLWSRFENFCNLLFKNSG